MQITPMQTIRHQYQTGELQALLEKLSTSKSSGILDISAQVGLEENSRSRVLIWRDGELAYGGKKVPDPQTLAKALVRKFNPSWLDSAMSFAATRVINQNSIQEMLDLLVKLRVFDWQQVQEYFHNRLIWTLEQILPYPGHGTLDSSNLDFDISYGDVARKYDSNKFLQVIAGRQLLWHSLLPIIPSIEVIPVWGESNLQNITDGAVRQHLEQLVDGKKCLIDIAERIDRDPLQIAQIYSNWTQKGWLQIIDPTAVEVKQLPTILTVDDSPIIQIMIKRALSSQYEILQAGGALESLNLLNQHGDRISLLILDLTMPDIDGLQLCRTIRSIPKFKDLPIIMLTARDGFFDKIKGQMAGSDRYLTKPFEAEKLMEIVQEYV
jgi:CheY-like chemotaxis protein